MVVKDSVATSKHISTLLADQQIQEVWFYDLALRKELKMISALAAPSHVGLLSGVSSEAARLQAS